ncbi:unnamed protein product [Chrysodeixis includens]|uniref:Uncharacterized protein n=1 Tax=Chrysodeixis includens TaxID=689277 RepID=A0A9N8PXJ2_CHRIL|nr:unnamed protein product [Chrysodeixis includens]
MHKRLVVSAGDQSCVIASGRCEVSRRGRSVHGDTGAARARREPHTPAANILLEMRADCRVRPRGAATARGARGAPAGPGAPADPGAPGRKRSGRGRAVGGPAKWLRRRAPSYSHT